MESKKGCGSWLGALVLAAAAAATPAAAQDDGPGGPGTRLSVSGMAFYTDNFYYSASGEEAAAGALIIPELQYLTQTRQLTLRGRLAAEYGMFDAPGSLDDYLDAVAGLDLAVQPTLRNQFRLDGDYKRGHDPFGVDRTEGTTARDAELDEWNQTRLMAHWRYGAPGARMNAEVGGGIVDKSYVTNRAVTDALSYDSTRIEYTLFYNHSDKTSALLDFSREGFSFDEPFGVTETRGGELYRIRAGTKWLATGKTSGDVRVGYRRRLFDNGSPDIEGLDWEAGVDWAPVPRATLRLETARSEQESYTPDARIIDVESVALGGKYNLSSRTRGTARLDRVTSDFDVSGRNDETLGLLVGAEHLALSYLWVVGNVGFHSRDSNVADRNYDQVTAFVGVRLGR